MYVCMYECMYVCMLPSLGLSQPAGQAPDSFILSTLGLSGPYVGMYVCVYACMYACTYVCTYVRMYGCICVCMYVCMYECMYVYVGRDSWTRLQSVGHRIEATRRSCSQPGWPFRVRATTDRDATGSLVQFCSSAQGVGGRPQAETFCCHARPLKD